jgi:hypothetical protein
MGSLGYVVLVQDLPLALNLLRREGYIGIGV